MNQLVDVSRLREFLAVYDRQEHADAIIKACQDSHANQHGHLSKWRQTLEELPAFEADTIELDEAVIIGSQCLDEHQSAAFKKQLLNFSPWRKGPIDLFGIHIDTEWRSDLKWQRLATEIDLSGKRILDVGCGNGYYMMRMLGAGASSVLGVDPVALYVIQFLLVNQYLKSKQLLLLPIGLESVPLEKCFDTVFSMGILYHRRSPMEHLFDLKSKLVDGGELVLETLVLEGEKDSVLVPQDRYAGMKNVWSIPTVPTLLQWLKQAGFKQIQVLDKTATGIEEQRQTAWMTSYSLKQFLDPTDSNLTIEGHPAPLRVMLKCSVS